MYEIYNELRKCKTFYLVAGLSMHNTECLTKITSNRIRYYPSNQFGWGEHIQIRNTNNCVNIYEYKDYHITDNSDVKEVDITQSNNYKIHIYALKN